MPPGQLNRSESAKLAARVEQKYKIDFKGDQKKTWLYFKKEGFNWSTINRWIRKAGESGGRKIKVQSGRPPEVMTPKNIAAVNRLYERHPSTTYMQAAKKLKLKLNTLRCIKVNKLGIRKKAKKTTSKQTSSQKEKCLFYQCLFCLNPCSEATPLIEQVEIHGAVRCVELQKQLQQLFILRQLLDVPSSWCEGMLQRDDGDSNPESWFRICRTCNDTVKDAWDTYQKLLSILEKMDDFKEQIKEVMLENIYKTRRKTGGLVYEIRNIVLADEMASLNNQDQKDSIELNVSSDFNPDSNSPLKKEDGEEMDHSDVDGDEGNADNIKILSLSSTRVSSRNRKRKKRSNSHTKGEFLCHICGSKYAYKSVLETHYRKLHPETNSEGGGGGDPSVSKQEVFKCKYCELTSPFKVIIIRHMQTHRAELGHQCDSCGQFYLNIQGLKRHKRINHPPTLEEHKCPAGENVGLMNVVVDNVPVKQNELIHNIHPPEAVSMSNMLMPLINAEVTQDFNVSTANIMYEGYRYNY